VKDIGSAVSHILQRRGGRQDQPDGLVMGTVTMGTYTTEHNDLVNRLVLYARRGSSRRLPPSAAAVRLAHTGW